MCVCRRNVLVLSYLYKILIIVCKQQDLWKTPNKCSHQRAIYNPGENLTKERAREREEQRESKWWSCSNSEDRSNFLPEACSAGFEWRRSSLLFTTDTHIFSFNVPIDLRLSNQNVCLANKTFKLWPHYQAFLQPVHIWSIIGLLPLNLDLAFALNTNHSAFANP